jgi:AsmA protein
MRSLRVAAYVIGGLMGLIVIALVAVLIFVNPNDYRADIEQLVERQTGRELTLSGDLKLSVFPWIALETGAASLGEAPGFGDEPFVSIQQARVSVRFWPLLRGSIEIGNVRLAGARIRLITDEQGRNSWADLGGESDAASSAQPSTAMQLPTIAGLEIRDAAVTLDNRQDKSKQVIRDFNLTTGRLQSGQPFELQTDFTLDEDASLSVGVKLLTTVTADLERNVHQLAKPQIDLKLTGQGYPKDGIAVQVRADNITAAVGHETYQVKGFTLNTLWRGEGYPAAGVPIALKATDLDANLAAQTLELIGLDLDAAGAHFTGALNGVEILDAPRITGPVKLDPLSLREWLPKVGVAPPQTTDPQVLKRINFASTVNLTKTSAELGDVTLQLDDTTLKGSLGVADFAAKAMRFDLNVDRINADRYLPPAADSKSAKSEKQAPTEIPVDMLRTLNARGQLRIGEAIFAGMKFTNLRLGVNAREGKVRFNPSEAAMYGGQYRGDISIDATGSAARVSLDEHVSAVDFAPLFRDLFETQRVSGKGTANIKLIGAGRTTDDIMKTLDGTLDFNVADGALEGADLWYEIRRARAVLKQQAVPERAGPPRTAFSAMKGTGVMKSGVLTNNDLDVSMQYLKVTGQGSVNLPSNTLDYRLVTSVLKIPREGADATQMQDLVDAQIPVRVTGALSDPKVRPDIEGYLKNEVKQRVEKERGKVEEKVKQKLGDKLKDLLGR